MLLYVRLWKDFNARVPSVEQRVQAPTPGHAVVQVMKAHHLHAVDRATVARSASEPPVLRVTHVLVRGKNRYWRVEPDAPTAGVVSSQTARKGVSR